MMIRETSARALAPARRVLLLGTALGCSISIFCATAPAHAGAAPNDACGAITRNVGPNNPDTVTCTSSVNSSTSGISYDQQTSSPTPAAPNDLTVVLQGGASPVAVNSSGVGVSVTNSSGASATVVSNTGVAVTSVSTGLYAGANGGTASVQNDGSVSAGGVGILAVGTNTAAASIQNTGSVTAVGAGLQASTQLFSIGSPGITITNSGALSVDAPNGTAAGIQAGYTNGKVKVTNSGAITAGAGATAPSTAFGINTSSVGDATVINNAGGVIQATASNFAVGIRAGQGSKYWANGGSVTNAADITVKTTGANGWAAGISAYGIGDGTTVTSTAGKIAATGYNAYGVRAYASQGNAAITISGGAVTANGGSGGDVRGAALYGHARNGTVSITGTSTYASGTNVRGISANGGKGVTITTGAVTTTGQYGVGVFGYSQHGPVDVTVSGPITTSGVSAPGVVAVSTGGDVGVTLNGAIKVSGASQSSGSKYARGAIYASATGAASVTGAGAVTATGDYTSGIIVTGQQGATVNVSGPIVVSGAASSSGSGTTGVAAFASNGDANVTVGSVTSTGSGVLALSGSGAANVTVNGAVKAEGKYGVMALAPANANSSATVTISSGGSVSGYSGVMALGAASTTVTNSGTITGNGGFAVNAQSKYGATLTNNTSGVINGAVRVYGYSSSVVHNAGVWNITGTSYIGGAPVAGPGLAQKGLIGPSGPAGVMYNTGTVNVAPGASAPTTVVVNGLGTWNNAGTINVTNGHPGNVLNLGTAAFNGLTGSKLTIDAPHPGVATDEVLAGAVSGVTVVNLAGPTGFDIAGGTFFKGTSGTASNFVVAPGVAHSGFIDYAIGFDPSSVSWSIYGLPAHAVFEALKLPHASQAFAERSDDVWHWRTQEIRDAEALGARRAGFEFWGQVYGGSETQDQTRNFGLSGADFRENLSTRDTWTGVQFGVDHLSDWRGGKLLWGFTGGYLDQSTEFRGGGSATLGSGANALVVDQGRTVRDQFDLSGLNLGGYVGWSRGGFFLNGLAKADFAGADLRLNSAGLKGATNTTTWSLNGEIGYRYGGPQFFVEPIAKVVAGETDVDAWKGAGAAVTYPGADNLQTSLGARVGGALAAGPIKLTPYVGGYWVDEALAGNRMAFSDGTTLYLRDAPARGFARFDAGLTAKAAYGVEGFAKVVADTGAGVSGVSGDVGVRWRW